MITVKPVASKSELASFVDFPHKLFEGDKNYVPELHIAQRDVLTPGKHPFHNHSSMKLFLAWDGKEIRGRIAAILNNNHNKFKQVSEGFFGFYDLYNDPEVSEKLLSEAEKWLAAQGATKVIGPVNPSTNETAGLLIEGFDSPPVAMMTYNKPYYLDLLTAHGYKKNVDLLAYNLPTNVVDKKTIQLKELLRKRLQDRNITIRNLNMKDFNNEVQKILEVYNAAWEDNTGFVPMTDEEFKYLAKDLKLVLDKDFAMVAEKEGKLIGFALAIPDINQVLIKIKRGRLFPTGLIKLLLGKKKINYVRVLALGVNREYRRAGIEAFFYSEIIQKAMDKKIAGGEASWILENNEMMNKGLIKMNAKVYKRYRLLEKSL
jgi:GNAT superfamily N-acetyltransferase